MPWREEDGWFVLTDTTLTVPTSYTSGRWAPMYNSTGSSTTWNYTYAINTDTRWIDNRVTAYNNLYQVVNYNGRPYRWDPQPAYTMEDAVINTQGQVVRTVEEEVVDAVTRRATREEIMAAHRLQSEERSRRRQAESQARIAAESRANELLMSMLSPDQVAMYLDEGHFDVVGSEGNRYRIETGVSGNILWLDHDGVAGGRICAHPTMEHDRLPTPDVMLGQMLALITDERAFCAVANVHAGRPPAVLARAS